MPLTLKIYCLLLSQIPSSNHLSLPFFHQNKLAPSARYSSASVAQSVTMSSNQASEQAMHSAESLSMKLGEAFPRYMEDFKVKWGKWLQATSSFTDPLTWSSVPEFDALVALGPKAVPMVLWELAGYKEEAKAVYLYNKLERNPEYTTTATTTNDADIDIDIDIGQQATAILEHNFKRARQIRNALLDWIEHCEMVSTYSSSNFYTETEEFEELVHIGPAVIPQLMLQYSPKRKDGRGPLFGYELMHDIVWGHKTGLKTIDLAMQVDKWVDWFEGGQYYNHAPHYLVPEEHY